MIMVMMLLWISVGKTIILAGTMKGQLGDMSIIPTQILQTKQHTYHKPLNSVVITSTDKTKRLVAINTTQCKDILRKSTIATGNYQPKSSKLNQPRMGLIKCNVHGNKIANKYNKRHPELCKVLKDSICCEPLPSPVYSLPKDHKGVNWKDAPFMPRLTLQPHLCLNS